MKVSDYYYDLPPELIASHPTPERDASRMLVYRRETGEVIHAHARDFPDFLQEGDLTVFNDSRVLRARIPLASGGEIFLVEPLGPLRWKCLVKPGRKFRVGAVIALEGCTAKVEQIFEDGCREISFDHPPDLEKLGRVPIPPYFKREADEEDNTRYQTVYAHEEGSVAAPTAGLHFTLEMLEQIPHTFLTLHVGLGTFLPVKTENIEEHVMHDERYTLSQETADAINAAKRIVAVGTTSVRVLESQPPGPVKAATGTTRAFIYPPYEFRHIGAMLTNFHLPCSTLLMLVSALAGREQMLELYRMAIAERYRFYSYGDCMLIL